MKFDGKAIAQAAMEKKKNEKLESTGEDMVREQEKEGSHIKAMMSLIEAIHHKDPETAHKHMVEYANAAAGEDSGPALQVSEMN